MSQLNGKPYPSLCRQIIPHGDILVARYAHQAIIKDDKAYIVGSDIAQIIGLNIPTCYGIFAWLTCYQELCDIQDLAIDHNYAARHLRWKFEIDADKLGRGNIVTILQWMELQEFKEPYSSCRDFELGQWIKLSEVDQVVWLETNGQMPDFGDSAPGRRQRTLAEIITDLVPELGVGPSSANR
ncbi:hypothetical protein MMC25_001439 [Agyrium rufum]|nr:hypothetical protein [Agyrium rufum]